MRQRNWFRTNRLWICSGAAALSLMATSCILGAGAEQGGAQAPKTNPKATLTATTDAPSEFLNWSWSDAGGNDGKGGVHLISKTGNKTLPLRDSDFNRKLQGDASVQNHAGWLLFYGSGSKSLSFEWERVTRDDEKFWAIGWAAAGVAFNQSWAAIDGSKAKYLVLWSKTSHPDSTFDISISLHSTGKSNGEDKSGKVSLKEYTEGKRLQNKWTRAVIPISAFPDLNKVDLTTLQTVNFDLAGESPENQRVFVHFDNIYLSDLDMVTPVDNLGYVLSDNDVTLVWDKDPAEKIAKFVVRSGGKEVASVPPDKRQVTVPLSKLSGGDKASVSVLTANATQYSSPISVKIPLKQAAFDAVTVTLDATPKHDISPYIFGANASPEDVKPLGVTVDRWGGNPTSKYNWEADIASSANDWYFLNAYAKKKGLPETEKGYYTWIKKVLSSGADANFTIPIGPWIAKPAPEEGGRLCSFPASIYPKQDKIGGEKCGNGLMPGGKEKIWDNDPNVAMVPNSVEFQKKFIENVKKLFGGAANKGVKFFTLDNEPGLWNSTHRDTVPKGISAEELADLNEKYAVMIKSVDPAAQVIGFSAWGVMELAGSNLDYFPPGPDGYKKQAKDDEKWSEVKKHGGKSQLVYLLERYKEMEKKNGKRMIDAIDVHWYPELYAKDSKGNGHRLQDSFPADPETLKRQWEMIREWYDPTFKPENGIESWTYEPRANGEKFWDPYHPVIPALKKIIADTYPGTKLCINEFATGGNDFYYGALLRAAVLGIFMQEDLYMSQNWYQVDNKKFLYYAQKLFGNYDGKGSRIGGKFYKSTSSSPDILSYAAKDADKWYVLLVNKSQKGGAKATIKLPAAVKSVETHQLAESLGMRLFAAPKQNGSKEVKVTVPAFSALLVVMK